MTAKKVRIKYKHITNRDSYHRGRIFIGVRACDGIRTMGDPFLSAFG